MNNLSLDALLEAGVHFGHRVSRWNPKMRPYIYGKRNLIHLIDLRHTIRGLIRARYFLTQLTADGHEILFVGTKRQAVDTIRQVALDTGMHFVTERWLGGTLTNYVTIRERLNRLEELERLEQDGGLQAMSKKMVSTLTREKKRIFRNLEGIRNMARLPGALIVVDPGQEHIAVKEANILKIPVVALLDTDCDPDAVDLCIPGNDDAFRSVRLILDDLAEAVKQGRTAWVETRAQREREESERRAREEREREVLLARQHAEADKRATEQAQIEAGARAWREQQAAAGADVLVASEERRTVDTVLNGEGDGDGVEALQPRGSAQGGAL